MIPLSYVEVNENAGRGESNFWPEVYELNRLTSGRVIQPARAITNLRPRRWCTSRPLSRQTMTQSAYSQRRRAVGRLMPKR